MFIQQHNVVFCGVLTAKYGSVHTVRLIQSDSSLVDIEI